MARLKAYKHQVVYPIVVYHAYQKFLVLTLAPPLHTQHIPDKLCVSQSSNIKHINVNFNLMILNIFMMYFVFEGHAHQL